jgi:putative addiction module component (TIGR02574 family)
MSQPILKSALKLPAAQRILLVEQIWDSVAENPDGIRLTDKQKAELDRRLARLKQTGAKGSSWSAVKSRIRKRS